MVSSFYFKNFLPRHVYVYAIINFDNVKCTFYGDMQEWSLMRTCLVAWIMCYNVWIGHSQTTFDVLQYGALGDGRTDDSPVTHFSLMSFSSSQT